MVNIRADELAVLVAVMPELRVMSPAPPRIEIFAVELVKVMLPTETELLTVVFPAAEKVALSPEVQETAEEPSHQVEPPVQSPLPPAVEFPAELQVTSAAERLEKANMHSSKPAKAGNKAKQRSALGINRQLKKGLNQPRTL
jgi:hypothetical protein